MGPNRWMRGRATQRDAENRVHTRALVEYPRKARRSEQTPSRKSARVATGQGFSVHQFPRAPNEATRDHACAWLGGRGQQERSLRCARALASTGALVLSPPVDAFMRG